MLKKIYSLLEPADQKKCLMMAIVVLLTSLLNFVGLASIFPVLKLVLDGNSLTSYTLWVMAGVLLFIIVKNLAVFGLQRIQTNFLLRQYRHFSYLLFCRYYKHGLLFIRNKGAIQLTNDVNSLCLTFSVSVLQGIFTMAGEALLTLLVLIALFVMSPLAAIFLIIVCLPLVAFYILVVRKKARIYGKEDLLARRKQARTVLETFRGFAELEINDAFETQLSHFSDGLDTINHSRKRMEMVRAFPGLLCEVAVILGLCFLLLVQGTDQLLIGGIFAVAAFRLMPSVKAILNCWTSLQQSSYCVETLQNELSADTQQEIKNESLTFEKELRAEHVTFAYPDTKPILTDFSCTVHKGECVGVQGTSGAGKSTLFNILLGFFPLQGGHVYVDDQELTGTNLKAWHQLVGYVPQEVFILQASLAENVALGAETVDEAKVRQVLEQVQLGEWVDSLPEGLNTHLGEAGNRLSGGQKQRIGIARALYKQAEVLFFDEATSALDNTTEMEINQTLRQLSETQKELTMVIIAHRTSSLAFCNRIISLSE